MEKGLKVIKVLLYALFLIFIMKLVTVILIVFVGISKFSLSIIDKSYILLIVSLVGEVSLPLFLFCCYQKNDFELKEVMPFKKRFLLRIYVVSYIAGLVFFALVWVGAVSLHGFSVMINWEGNKFSLFMWFFIGYIIQGGAEEILFRGYLQERLMRIVSIRGAIVISAIVFSLFHIANAGITIYSLIELFVFGVAAGIVRFKTNNLTQVSAFHSAWNFAQGPLFGVSVSGSVAQSFVFKSIQLPGKEWVNGGVFGIEGSFFSIAGHFLLLSAVIIWWRVQTKKVPQNF